MRTNRAAVITSCITLCAAMLFGVAATPVAATIQSRPTLQPVAILTVISGDVLMRTTGDFTLAMDGTVLYVGSVLRTSADARALITLFEGSTMELDPSSDVTIEDATARGSSTFAQMLGRGWHVVTRLTSADSRYEFRTPSATASVRGIDLELAAADGAADLPTTLTILITTTQLVAAPAAPAMTVQNVVAAPTTTVRASTAVLSPRSDSRAEKIGRVITEKLTELARAAAGKSRDGDHDDDRGDED
jgi:hypothetical protein